MYESFFSFTSRPFIAVPQTSRYFPATAIEAARCKLNRCIERAEGCGLIIGPTGSGKTLLCEVLAEYFSESLTPVLLTSLRLTTCKELLQTILHHLGVPHRRLQEGELRLALIDHLNPEGACPNGILLIADEAHTFPPRLFEELRLLTNLVRNGSPRIRLIMAGGTVLEERFAHPRMASFNQRISARCYLESLTANESMEFVRAQTANAGVDPDHLWDETALRAIHRNAVGCPRLVNQLCDHALILASQAGVARLTETEIDVAWADLQQLPLASNSEASNTNNGNENHEQDTNVIEFGSLDGDSVAVSEIETKPLPPLSSQDADNAEIEFLKPPQAASAVAEYIATSDSLQDGIPSTVAEASDLTATPDEPVEEPLICTAETSQVTLESSCQKIAVDHFQGVEADHVIQIPLHGELAAKEQDPETVANTPAESIDRTVADSAERASNSPSGLPEAPNVSVSLPENLVGLTQPRPGTEGVSQPPSQESINRRAAVAEHPLIPVRQRDYRELFARLYEPNLPENRPPSPQSGCEQSCNSTMH